MTNVVTLPSELLLRERAGTWIARIDRGLLPEERTELRQWLDEHVRHRGALLEMSELWDRMDALGEIADLFPLQPKASPWTLFLTRPLMGLSLALILAGVSVGLWVNSSGTATHIVSAVGRITGSGSVEGEYATAVGEQRVVALPDQSIIMLNTATLLRVHFTSTERRIELVRGQAHFQVAKHEGRVFSVQVGANEFRALGTAFDIRVKSERGIELTVTEGRVKVRVPWMSGVGHVIRPGTAQPAPTEIMVDAGKEVAIDNSIQTVERLEPAQMQAALAWQKGMIVFDAEPLETAIREVSRYSNTRFVIIEERAKRLPVSGYFRAGDIDGLIWALHNNFNIDATRNGDVVTLSSRRGGAPAQ